MSRLNKISIFIGFIFFIGAILIAVSFHHWWLKNIGSVVFVDGENSEQAAVFRNAGGDFLVVINDQGHSSSYIAYSTSAEIGVPNNGQFIFIGVAAYSKDLPVPVVRSSNRIKMEDMSVRQQNEWIEFTGMEGRRIRLFRSSL